MKPSKKSKKETEISSLVAQLQDLASQIHQQVDQELARLEQARHLAAGESARLESLLAKIPAKANSCPKGAPEALEQVPPDCRWQHASSQPDAQDSLMAKHRKIYDLSDQGLDLLEIAQRTDQTPGQVQVILALRKSE